MSRPIASDPLSLLGDHLARRPDQPVPRELAAAASAALRRLDGSAVRRDIALRAAAHLLAPEATPWEAAGVVAAALAWRKRGRAAGEVDELLDAVLNATRPVCSQRKVYDVLRGAC